MRKLVLPPMVEQIADGKVKWNRLEGVKYDVLGYFLCCHLIIEHYLDEYLCLRYPSLDWDAARPTFGQKVALMSKFKVSEQYDCVPAIKHLNSLRNKLSHNIAFKIDSHSLLPLRQYLLKAYQGNKKPSTSPKMLLEEFTSMVCGLLAGVISGAAQLSKKTLK